MLKALELSGFKSFADRTRFDFSSGVCVVVGPNGSGKSNVVDAVKWVLGSQSAKSLRGKEMTDVIFNGCPTRHPMGTGEVTLTLENADRRLAIDSNEVHVTRRVYRSGEGEYLINRQPCRLKDIRELLAATGMTTEAYCIIEQGKVDALLQSSPRDRRIIFEEAAGISQFKAKKAIAQRRMERVEQNLLRLSDIVDEVESRLKSIRSQAGKAKRYKECTERLQQLRTEVALVDWRHLTKQIDSRQAQSIELKKKLDDRAAAVERADGQGVEFEQKIEAESVRTREIEALASAIREHIAGLQAKLDGQVAQRRDLQLEIDRTTEHLANLMAQSNERGGSDQLDEAAEKEAVQTELASIQSECESYAAKAAAHAGELEKLTAQILPAKNRLADSEQEITRLAQEIVAIESEIQSSVQQAERIHKQIIAQATERERREPDVAKDQHAEAELKIVVDQHRTALAASEGRRIEARHEFIKADAQHRRTEAQLTRVRERIAVLSELESRLEGLDGGVQEILRIARESPAQHLGEVHGVIADLFHVDVDSAPLVEVALGERAQYIVVSSSSALIDSLHAQPMKVAGRVGFLGVDQRHASTALDNVDLSGEPGVMGRADRFIESAPEYQVLARRLLGRTWLVDRLATALRLAHSAGRGLEFVTGDGELLCGDGTIVVGPRQAATGVLSRRSELRACHEQAAVLEQQHAEQAAEVDRCDKDRARQEELVATTVAAFTAASTKLAECHRKAVASAAQLERVLEWQQRLELELQQAQELQASSRATVARHNEDRTVLELTAGELKQSLDAAQAQIDVLDQEQAELLKAVIERRIAVARAEQRVDMVRQQMEQAHRTRQERDQMLAEMRERLTTRAAQIAELEAAVTEGKQSIAELQTQKEIHAQALAQRALVVDEIRRGRQAILDRVRIERQELTAMQMQLHKQEVATTRQRHERQTLCDRMREDYGIHLEEAALNEQARVAAGDAGFAESGPIVNKPAKIISARATAQNREAAEREIAELRDQINNIGAINLEALNELEQLEERFAKLSSQHRDLVDAKTSLERLTQRINTDSRQLFLTTVDTVRGHFQELFRRLFGGGEANIVVDDTEDVLESGIEIIARPPGKEACSISLLSGGEKTLTCVALLLAVFRSKPSPFCILDEVDAALDEANIGRFTAVLKEFLSFTQFIVITHSKKTMSGADTLYGITMEESGVSKRVSVRFEDVSEDGHILPSAMFRAKSSERSENASSQSDDVAAVKKRAA
ncbi:MAG TPA: chromosome segregation protein SMC [Lacipirellulaceae bacterium]|jgi:chromosome segregation protein|nr:chromosome segregation protein SMC [Lacipirellulaceae bacterium]